MALFHPLILLLVLVACVTDLRSRIIPNWVCAAIALLFPVAVAVAGSAEVLLSGLAAAAVVLLTGAAVFAVGWLGGGDVKLMAALSLWIGFDGLLPFVVATSLAGGLIAILMLPMVWRKLRRREAVSVPYGLAIGLGGLFCFAAAA